MFLLGEDGAEENFGPSLHEDVAVRWEKLITKYASIANYGSTCCPKMNPEIKGVIPEATLRRDERLIDKQKQISPCPSAVGNLTLIKPKEMTKTDLYWKLLDTQLDY